MKLLLLVLLALFNGSHHSHPRRAWRYAGTYDVTAYCFLGNRTASGGWPSVGMAASNLWPFGTRLRVQGVGVVTVTDRTDGLTSLDVYMGRDGCEPRALAFGRRYLRVAVAR